MKLIKWNHDPVTLYWASRVRPRTGEAPRAQYAGHPCAQETWRRYTLEDFPPYCEYERRGYLFCSPSNIIKCFAEARMLEALALTVAWGGMARTVKYVYTRPYTDIEEILSECRKQIEVDRSLEGAWQLLRTELSWTNVMISKSMHFMVRSLGYETNPPIPIDNQVILNQIWPMFRTKVIESRGREEPFLPGEWRDYGHSWTAYNRYMTAINTWARITSWTTTELENTLFGASEMDVFNVA